MPQPTAITVKITAQRSPLTWYKVGEQHEVYAAASTGTEPYYITVDNNNRFIFLSDCEKVNN